MTTITEVAIPISTFILGIVVTLALNKYEQRETLRRQNIQEITNLINDWYNQLYEIASKMNRGHNKSEIQGELYFYINNRIILPKVIFSLELLRHYKKCRNLVSEAEAFLELVTNYREVYQKRQSLSALRCTFSYLRHKFPDLPDDNLNDFSNPLFQPAILEFVKILDGQLQKVNLEGARAIG